FGANSWFPIFVFVLTMLLVQWLSVQQQLRPLPPRSRLLFDDTGRCLTSAGTKSRGCQLGGIRRGTVGRAKIAQTPQAFQLPGVRPYDHTALGSGQLAVMRPAPATPVVECDRRHCQPVSQCSYSPFVLAQH